jgi:hypothetical protein
MGYGQSYYTLRSIFMDGVPPPTIHLHLRMFNVRHQVPIGDLSASNPSKLPNIAQQTIEIDIPEEEKQAFDLWLRELWHEKDESMSRFFASSTFCPKQKVFNIPLKLRSKGEILDAFGFFPPAVFRYFLN